VKSPDQDDLKNLTRVIQYIRDTQDITLTLEAENNPQWWVDSSYAVHPDMKSHTGVLMSIVNWQLAMDVFYSLKQTKSEN